jgi:hypothetical protein
MADEATMGACIARASILAGDTGALSLAGTLFISCDEHQTQDADDRYLRRGDVSNRRKAAIAGRENGRPKLGGDRVFRESHSTFSGDWNIPPGIP